MAEGVFYEERRARENPSPGADRVCRYFFKENIYKRKI